MPCPYQSNRSNFLAITLLFLAFVFPAGEFAVNAQSTINMQNGTVLSCAANFYDAGGAAGNYANNENYTLTITSANGSNLLLNFSSFSTQAGSDVLRIYNGPDNQSPLIGQYSGASMPPVIISNGPSLCFHFTSNGSTTSTGWAATVSCPAAVFYSYQNGAWNDPNVWTLDPSGTVWMNPSLATPGAADKVVIRNARRITAAGAGRQAMVLTIEEGGTLDLQTFAAHAFSLVTGRGLLRIGSGVFPAGDFTSFTGSNGGTIEYYGAGGFTITQPDFYNLTLNLSDSLQVAVLKATPFRTRGVMQVKSGILQINDNATNSLALQADSTLLVDATGRITVGSGNVKHDFTLLGDFLNNGNVRFTTRVAPDFLNDNNPRVHVHFTNDKRDQSVQMNGPTVFYRIHCSKGVDDTYVLNLDASDTAWFKLYGPNNIELNSPSGSPPNIRNNDALGLEAGTLRLGANIIIPALASSVDYTVTGAGYIGCNYYIDQDAMLWVDGATVNTSYYLPPSNHIMSIMSVYGKLKITAGTINCQAGQGIGLRQTGQMIMEGGTVNTRIIRTSAESSAHRGAYRQTGGSVVIRRDFSTFDGFAASFHLGYTGTSFTMSGGTMEILRSTPLNVQPIFGTSGREYIFCVSSDPRNINITGGTITLHVDGARNSKIATKGYFNNLVIVSDSSKYSATLQDYPGSSYNEAITAIPLEVRKDFTLQDSGVYDAANYDLTVAGNFTIHQGATYKPGNNSTIFNGLNGQLFSNNGTISSGLNNFSVLNKSNTSITKSLLIKGNLLLQEGCFLHDMGQQISLLGNLQISGTHTSQGNGRIQMDGTAAQLIYGDGKGSLGNLFLNKTGGSVSLGANLALTGTLRLANTSAVFNIGSYLLSVPGSTGIYDDLAGTGTTFSSSRMILMDGSPSAGGLTRSVATANDVLFPVGTTGKYQPAIIRFASAPSPAASINIKPVGSRHPLAASDSSLGVYWNVEKTDGTPFVPGSISLRTTYTDADVAGNEGLYIPGWYTSGSWSYNNNIADVLDFTNEILYSAIPALPADFTAGKLVTFGTVTPFYSRASGNWSTASNWTHDTISGTPASGLPGINDPVIIRRGHTITIPGTDPSHTVGSLTVRGGGILDLTTGSGHHFGIVRGGGQNDFGKIRISSSGTSAEFPSGDFGLFLSAGGGTVEYYTTLSNLTIPIKNNTGKFIPGYNKLQLSASGSLVISMPDTNLVIADSMLITGTGNGIARMVSSAPRNIRVEKSLLVKSGSLDWSNNQPVSLEVLENLVINTSASLAVLNANTAVDNQLILNGSLINNGTLDLSRGSGQRCLATFTGSVDAVISGTGATTDFYTLTLDKGTGQEFKLLVQCSALSFGSNPGLVLRKGTFRLDKSSLTITPSTSVMNVPATSCLSVNAGTMNLCTGASDNNDLFLSGKLEVLGGTLSIGNTGGGNNNDIEYSAAGSPEIQISGGTFTVYGQVRRHPTIATGALRYDQSAGTINILGRNRLLTRALLEVQNPFSSFVMTGGTLILENGGGTTFGDLSLVPASSSVTGGTVQFGNAISATSSFTLFTECPIYNLSIYDGRNLSLKSFPLTVLNNLSIGATLAYLNTNGLDVTVRGNFTNLNNTSVPGLNNGGYRPVNETQVTIFDGQSAGQVISGTGSNLTSFGTVRFSNASQGSVLLQNGSVRVEGNLEVLRGTLNAGSISVDLLGNMLNQGIYRSGTGNINFMKVGAAQDYQGTEQAECGNLRISNQSGLILSSPIRITGVLNLSGGPVYIRNKLLTLGDSASVTGSFGATRMIIGNGALSDGGIRKEYPVGSNLFLFPIGVSSHYTPVEFSVNSSTAGWINVKPVNDPHPGNNDILPNELAYYWNVVSSGFTSPTVSSSFIYNDNLVRGNETQYVNGRYVNYSWQPVAGTIDTVQDKLTYTGVAYIDGEYTAGAATNFISKQRLYSVGTGTWTNPSNWSYAPSGIPACNCTPDGNPVSIRTGHVITVPGNGAYAYSVDIPATAILDLGQTIQHNLGHTAGAGTIRITSTSGGSFIFPGGEYDNFFGTAGSTVEYTGNGTLPPEIPVYWNVTYLGVGTTKEIAAFDYKVNGLLNIKNGFLDNSGYHRSIVMNGNWKNDVSSGFIPGRGLISFEGSNLQTITSLTAENFYNLRLNKTGGEVNLLSPLDLSQYLLLSRGFLRSTGANILTLTNQNPAVVYGASDSAFILGPVRKIISNASYFTFPVGDELTGHYRFGPLKVDGTVTGANAFWTGQYFYTDPAGAGMPATQKQEPIQAVSSTEYWQLSGPVGGQAIKVIRWDEESEFIPASDDARNKLRLVEWMGTVWQKAGDVVNIPEKTLSNATPGALQTGFYTIGLELLSTAHITGTDLSLCNDGSQVSVPVILTGDAPWTLTYAINGVPQTQATNIGSSPYSIVLTSTLLNAIAGPGDYTITLVEMKDKNNITGVVYGTGVVVHLLQAPNPVISGKTTVNINESGLIYSIPSLPSSTYAWTITNGSISSGQGTNSIIVTWGGTTGAAQVRVEHMLTTTGCTKTVNLPVNIVVTPKPDISGSNFVCAGDTILYTTPSASGHTYTWGVAGGILLNSNGSSSMRVKWNTGAGNKVWVLENSGTDTGSDTLLVTVNALPPVATTVLGDTICEGAFGQVTLLATPPGISYSLFIGNTQIGSYVPSLGGGTISLSDPAGPVITQLYSVHALNTETACKSTLTNTASILVQPVPFATLQVTDSAICSGTSVTFTASGGNQFIFSRNDIIVQSGPSPTYSANNFADGDHIRIFTNYTGSACYDTSRTVTMQVSSKPVAGIAASGTDICAGEQVTFTGSGGEQYDFYRNGSLVQSSTQNQWKSFDLQNNDQVQLITSMLSSGCSDTSNLVMMTVHAVPAVLLSVSDSAICGGTPVSFTASGGFQYVFTRNGAIVQSGTNPIYSADNFSNGDKIRVLANYSGTTCYDTSRTVTMQVSSKPVAGIAASGTDICAGEQVTFTGSGGEQYDFYRNGSLVQSSTQTEWKSSGLQNNDRVQLITSMLSSGCSDTSSLVMMTVQTVPIAELSVSDSSVCTGSLVSFTTSGGVSYEFLRNGMVVQSGTGIVYESDAFVNGDVIGLIAYSEGKTCSDTAQPIHLLMEAKPVAGLLADATSLCSGETVQFTASGGSYYEFYLNGTLQYSGVSSGWSSGSLADQDLVYARVYASAGGCSESSDVLSLTVYETPVASLVASSPVACSGIPLTYDATGGTEWAFYLNGNKVQEGADSHWTLADPSTGDQIWVIASTQAGMCADTSSPVEVQVYPTPDVQALTGEDTLCSQTQLEISCSGATNYSLWVNGEQASLPSASEQIEWTVPEGTYLLSVIGTTSDGCSDTSELLTIEGLPAPAKPVIVADGPLEFIEDDSVQLSAPFSAAYLWSDNSTSSYIIVKTTGDFSVQVFNELGCGSPVSDPVNIRVSSFLSKPVVSLSGATAFCEGGSVDLSSSSGDLYEWSDGSTGRILQVTASGSYSVVVKDLLGHISPRSDEVTVEVYPVPLAAITDSGDVSCFGGSDGTATVEVAGGTGPYTYLWSNGQDLSVATQLPAGAAMVTVTDANACKDEVSLTIHQPSEIKLSGSVTNPACPDNQDGAISLSITGGSAPYTVEWQPAGTDTLLSGLDAGAFRVTVTDTRGCKSTDEWNLSYVSEYCLRLYEMFTPNGDLINDLWEIDGADAYPEMVIEIFDRWGKRVFYSRGYKPWDGRSEGRDLPMDSYHYVISPGKGREPIIGNVTIVR
ncbi:MAG: gliding motility-associated C-terminal domain-containing protein [Bacteroidales bacterium]